VLIRFLVLALLLALTLTGPVAAQTGDIQALLQEHRAAIEKGQRRGIEPVIAALAESGLPQAADVLQAWGARDLWQRKSDGLFFFARPEGDDLRLTDIASGADAGIVPKAEMRNLKPNSGIRGVIAAALVQFQLQDPDPARRQAALDAIARDPEASHLEPLRAAVAAETDPAARDAKARLERLLTIRFDPDESARVAAIESFSGALEQDVLATLNPLVATVPKAFAGTAPEGTNHAGEIPFDDLGREAALDLLVRDGILPAAPAPEERRAALAANIVDGKVGDVPVADLSDPAARDRAWAALVAEGKVPPAPTEAELAKTLSQTRFYAVYAEASPAVSQAARDALDAAGLRMGAYRTADLALDALSLASIYFLAAIGLAITFGVMGVINMAHGEFIMMGAYTGYVVQQIVPDYTLSILLALPLAFAVTFGAGVAMERLVIRWLYNRPLETLLATFGISIALQQIAKNIFGTQARPLTAPGWLDGQLVLNELVAISYIRIAIFALALAFLCALLFILRRTRLGLEVRAVTQNPRMAASMGINPDRINMLTFGLGSGIAGIAGVAIGLYAKVTSELGADYIVQSFMTVVVGGVGNIWGSLLGATLIGSLQKGIEWLNPSNTLAAQTYMILFIILFIQVRPRGIIALRGRAAGD
jgi:urea transport system permease protein